MTVLPHYYQHVDFATRAVNTLDLAYTNTKKAFEAVPLPHFGSSDHISVMLIHAYRPLLTREKPPVKQVRVWPEGAMKALQDCFGCMDWDMCKKAATDSQHTNLEEYAASVSAYMEKCIEDICVTKTITIRANQKPWMSPEVRGMLRA